MIIRKLLILLIALTVVRTGLSAVGVLTLTPQLVPLAYVIDSAPITLDSNLRTYYNTAVYPTYMFPRIANGAVNTAGYNLEVAGTWPGGSIIVGIDTVANNNLFDRLTCTLADITTMTSVYDVTLHQLTIETTAATKIADIQATLRSIQFSTKGMCAGIRNIRIWMQGPNYRYVNFNNTPRMIGMGFALRTAVNIAPTLFSYVWNTVNTNMLFEPRYFGVVPYFATIMNADENAAIQAENNYNGYFIYLGAKYTGTNNINGYWTWQGIGPDSGVSFWQGTGYGPAAVSAVLSRTGRGVPVPDTYNDFGLSSQNGGYNLPDNYAGTADTITELYLGLRQVISNHWDDEPASLVLGGYGIKVGGIASGPNADQNIIQVNVLPGNPLIYSLPY